MATAKYNPNKLPDSIKIDDITSGRIDAQLIYQELNRLKVELNILRNDMNNFLKVLIEIPTNGNGSVNEQEYFKIIASRLKTLKDTINEYCLEYNRLLPIINLAQIKLGHEVEILPPPNTNKNVAANAAASATNGNAAAAAITAASTTNTTTTTTTTGATNGALAKNANKRNSIVKPPTGTPTASTTNGGKAGANVNQPIVL